MEKRLETLLPVGHRERPIAGGGGQGGSKTPLLPGRKALLGQKACIFPTPGQIPGQSMAATGRRPRTLRKSHSHPPGPGAQAWLSLKLTQGDTASHHEAAASDKRLHQGGRGRSTGGGVGWVGGRCGEQRLISDEGGAGTLQTALLHTHQAPLCTRELCAPLRGELKA